MMDFDFSKEPGRQLLRRGLIKEGKPLVSIITPYYNAGRFFTQTFNCVINQTFPWFEWIIVDDGSTNMEDVDNLRNVTAADGRIRVTRKSNGGAASARNTAVRLSATDIIVPLDADDLIGPTYLEEVYWALKESPDCAWAYTDSVGFGGQEYLWVHPFSATRMKRENLLVCTAGIRKKEFLDAGGYDESTKTYDEDWHLWLRLLGRGKGPVHLNSVLFWYRRHNKGVRGSVNSDSGLRQQSVEKIKEAARKVDCSVMAKEFPFSEVPGRFCKPKFSDWDRPVFTAHRKIHVTMLIPWMQMGGADRFNLEICQGLNPEQYEMSILTTVPDENVWGQHFEEHVTDIFTLPSFLAPQDYPEFISYFLASRQTDILFLSNSYYGYYLLPWLRSHFPNLAIIDYVHMEEWYWRSGGYARVSGVMGGILEKTYVCNERTRQVMIRDFGRKPESVETLYIGVDEERFSSSAVSEGIARKELGIAEGRPIVLFPCRIQPQKRPFLMLEIADKIRQELTDIAFVVVGEGPQARELRQKSEQRGLKGTVYFAGRRKDMRPFYRDCALTLICSLKEGLALTAYESLAMGKPVVTSDVGGQSELVDGSVGRILPLMQDEEKNLDSREFPAEETARYVKAIREILMDKGQYEAMCQRCRERIAKKFSTKVMIDRLQDIFDDFAGNKESLLERMNMSNELRHYVQMTEELPILFDEITAYEYINKNSYASDTKNELMRIANSKWGSRIIKMAFKLRLNRIFH